MAESEQTVAVGDVSRGLVAVNDYVVGSTRGEYFALTRWCRHRRGDLARGSIDADGCLVCPVHGARFDIRSGRAVDGPQVPGGGLIKRMMNRHPLERRPVEVEGETLRIR